MPVRRPDQERINRVFELLRKDAMERNAPPMVSNAEELGAIDEPRYLRWRGRRYRVDPIPVKPGARLLEIQMSILRAGAGIEPRKGKLIDAYLDAIELMGELIKPTGWRRAFSWILPNPFLKASEKEIGQVLDFLWICRTGIPFQFWMEMTTDRIRSTSWTGGMSSRPSSNGNRGTGGTIATG